MIELHIPWLELAVLIPALGAVVLGRTKRPEASWWRAIWFNALTLICAVGAWWDFGTLHTFEAHDKWSFFSEVLGYEMLVIDELSAPLLPLAALLHLMTTLTTLRTKQRRFSFAWNSFSESILMATLACKEPWGVIALLTLSTVPPALELMARGKSIRIYALHMGLFVALMVIGYALVEQAGREATQSAWAMTPLIAAVLIRSGVCPVHCWMTDLFENATFGTALLFVTPMAGAYAAMRLVMPIAPDWALQSIAILSLLTSVYAAGMAMVQHEARRFFCYLLLSHASLVLVGLELATPIGLTGALSVWISVGLSLGGFGLTLRSMESRTGRLTLDGYHGYAEQTPVLASFFLLTGLASVGFPGTIGFIAIELMVESALDVYPIIGLAVIVAAAINGIAVVSAFFKIFTGTKHLTTISLSSRPRERFAVITMTLLILGGGLYPQPGIHSRHHAAMKLLENRIKTGATTEDFTHDDEEEGHVVGEHDEPSHEDENHDEEREGAEGEESHELDQD